MGVGQPVGQRQWGFGGISHSCPYFARGDRVIPALQPCSRRRCGPCQRIGPLFEALSEEEPNVVFVKVDVDENEETSQACGISCMPTFHFYKNGAKIEEFSGANETKIKEAVAKHK